MAAVPPLKRRPTSEQARGSGLKRAAAGSMIDDGRDYEYVWGGFERLRQVNRTTDLSLVAEYRCNRLGHRLSWRYDTDEDSDVDGSDETYHVVYNLKWRPVATYLAGDDSPKER